MNKYSLKFKLEPEESRRTLTEEELRELYKKSSCELFKESDFKEWIEKGLREDFLRLLQTQNQISICKN